MKEGERVCLEKQGIKQTHKMKAHMAGSTVSGYLRFSPNLCGTVWGTSFDILFLTAVLLL